jgi:Response regulator containing a CheY-like receiver domain and an HTH DNA-binding domain
VTGDPISCLVADDQAMVREGFGALLAAQPDLTVVGQAADGRRGSPRRRAPTRRDPDGRPHAVMDGLEATRRILEHTSDGAPRVLMLTTFDLDEYVYDALRSGASGFLLKDAPAEELVHAVRVVAAGDALVSPSVMRRLIADFVHSRSACGRNQSRSTSSLHASARSCTWSPAAYRTLKSARRWSSRHRRRRRTSGVSSASSTYATAPKPS